MFKFTAIGLTLLIVITVLVLAVEQGESSPRLLKLSNNITAHKSLSTTESILDIEQQPKPNSADSQVQAVPAEMRAQLADIATAYAQNARYPDYSKPLQREDWQSLHPQAFIPRKASLSNMVHLSATIMLDRYIVDRSVEQPVQVQLHKESGFDTSLSVSAVEIWLQQNAKRSPTTTLTATGQHFAGVLAVPAMRSMLQGETAVMAQIVFSNGQRSLISTMIKLYEPEAKLLKLGEAYIDGADLVIPAQFELNKAGNYIVAANLFNAENTEPISHLTAEMTLSPTQKTGLLKVHAATLRAKQAASSYLLKDVDITRLPDNAGELTSYGSSVASSFAVRAFPLESYSHEPYNDPAAQQKLAFLQKLATAQ